jgi:hypothetical protein
MPYMASVSQAQPDLLSKEERGRATL